MSISQELSTALHAVNHQHQQLEADPQKLHYVELLQAWQNQRIAQTYQDFLGQPMFEPAVRFMINDLYGGESLRQRDAQMQRAYAAMIKFLPESILATVVTALKLSLLANTLDLALAEEGVEDWSMEQYAAAIRANNSLEQRFELIRLTTQIGEELSRIVRKPFIASTLKLCRTPAKLAGLQSLQDYLERGFHAFKTMRQPEVLLLAIQQREERILANIKAGTNDPFYLDQ